MIGAQWLMGDMQGTPLWLVSHVTVGQTVVMLAPKEKTWHQHCAGLRCLLHSSAKIPYLEMSWHRQTGKLLHAGTPDGCRGLPWPAASPPNTAQTHTLVHALRCAADLAAAQRMPHNKLETSHSKTGNAQALNYRASVQSGMQLIPDCGPVPCIALSASHLLLHPHAWWKRGALWWPLPVFQGFIVGAPDGQHPSAVVLLHKIGLHAAQSAEVCELYTKAQHVGTLSVHTASTPVHADSTITQRARWGMSAQAHPCGCQMY